MHRTASPLGSSNPAGRHALLVLTCSSVTFVHDTARREHRLGIPMGAVAPIAQVMDLGREWYARHADPDWRKWTVREAAEIFRKVGLVGDFWEIPVTEGGF